MVTAHPLIRLTGISFAYPGSKVIFDNLDFALCQGEKIGLVGANGCGKSTLLHLIMGLLKPTRGEIEIFGEPVRSERHFKKVRTKLGFVFQNADDQLFSPTVLEDVAFGPLNQGYSPGQALTMARRTLADLQLDGFEDRITYKLSGGEKKLVSLATVLVMKPQVLMLDEPTTGLDEDTVGRITAILEGLDLSSIIVTHEQAFFNRVTTKVYRLDQ
jgi:cobalt/nickel transport system ATP-binding protein